MSHKSPGAWRYVGRNKQAGQVNWGGLFFPLDLRTPGIWVTVFRRRFTPYSTQGLQSGGSIYNPMTTVVPAEVTDAFPTTAVP